MSREPKLPTWFPEGKVDPLRSNSLSIALQRAARQGGFTREEYAVAVGQMAEALSGFDAADDLDGEVLRFVCERLRATADALDGSVN